MTVHNDYFGRPIEVGDILLSAKSGGKFFDTAYAFVIVTSKTTKLLRVHQLGMSLECLKFTKEDYKQSLHCRVGRAGGKAHPAAFVKTGVTCGLTEAEIALEILNSGKPQKVTFSTSSLVATWFP